MRKSFYLTGLLAFCFILFSGTVRATVSDPHITSGPVNDTVFAGNTAQFKIGVQTVTIEVINCDWQVSSDAGATWTDITSGIYSFDTISTLSINTTLSLNGNWYRCIASTSLGFDTSSPAVLTVWAGHPPTITSNPHDTTVCSGTHTWFAVAGTNPPGPTPLVYTWKVSYDAGNTWDTVKNSNIYATSTSDTLHIATNHYYLLNGTKYVCNVANDSGSAWSSIVTLHVDTLYAISFSGNMPVCAGSVLTLSSNEAAGVWSNVNHSIDTVDNAGNVYGKAQGFDTVKYTITNTCGVISSSVVVEVDTFVTNLPITGPSATCVGNYINLMNANVIGTGTWSGSNASASISATGVVSGIAYGPATFTYSFANACNSIDTTYTVQVDTVLAHGTISGPKQVCVGSWINLTATAPDGIWLTNNSSIANADFSGNVTGISQGVVVISYYLSNGCGVSAALDTITVFSTAAEITGNDSVGIGNTNALYDATVGGTWSTTATTVTVNGTSGVVTGVSAGTAEITYTVTNICGTTYSTMVIYSGSPSAGTIHGADSVCLGFTITLSDNTAGGSWTTSNDTIATVSSTGVVTGLAHGVAHITYTITNGFGTAKAVTAVFVNKAPHDSLVVPGIFSLGGSYTLFGYPAAGGTWSSSNHAVGNFIGSPGFFVIYGSGTDTITYSVHNTCGTTDTSFVINIPYIAGVNQVTNAAAELNVYPNPSTGEFMINLVSGITEPAVVTIANIVGEKVKEFTISTNQASALKLDQPDGIYFLTATSSTGKYSAKITITK